MDCLFCKIAARKLPAKVLYEDDKNIAFLDIHPLAVGHTVIVSREHAATITGLPDAFIGPLFLAVKRVTKLLEAGIGAENFTIGINDGKLLGHPDISHLHVHVIPRFKGDGGGDIHSVVKNPPVESLDQVHAKIVRQVAHP